MSLLGTALQALVEPSRRLGHPSLPRRLLDAVVPARVAGRHAWAADGRAAISAQDLDRPESGDYIGELQEALEEHGAALWARVNAPLGRIVVGLAGDGAVLPELVAIVAEVEGRHVQGPRWRRDGGDAPIDPVPVERAAVELFSEVAGIAAAVAARLLGARPVAPELAAAVSILDNTPRLRHCAEQALGQATADTVSWPWSVQGSRRSRRASWGLAVDAAQRGLVLAEARAEGPRMAGGQAAASGHAGIVGERAAGGRWEAARPDAATPW